MKIPFAGLRLLLVLALLGPCSLVASAAQVAVFNTGVDASGARLAGGATDTHWQVVAGPGITVPIQAVVVTQQHPVGQYFETADSAWIWSNAEGVSTVGATYTFELQFDLTGFDASTASLSGSWGVDNDGSISFNGASPIGSGEFTLTGSSFSNFNNLHAFSITDGFVAGINRLRFDVVDSGNPAALNVVGLTVTVVPEPAAWSLLVGGLALLGARSRRRRPG